MIRLLRQLLLLVGGELAKAALAPTIRRSLPTIYAVADARLLHALKTGTDRDAVEAIVRSSVLDVTRQVASREDVTALISLFDVTRLPGR